MNSFVEEMLMHYGMPRRSGRYPWGSGDNPYQHSGDFLSRVEEMKKSGFTFTDKDGKTYTGEVAIAKSMGLSTTQFRTQMSLAKDERRSADVSTAKALREKGYSLNEIAEKIGFANDSSVRSLLNESSEARMNQAKTTAEFLKKQIAEKGMIDVGTGVERELGISKEKLNQALYILEMEGYPIYGGGVPQVTNPGKQTNIKVICPPGTEHKEIYNFENVHSVRDYISYDEGESFRKAFEYPSSMDSKRLQIRYAEDGGIQKDGVIELRRGVDDLSLGDAHYAQVRILVDGTHYLKGMAVYSDDLPDGVDVVFNTNKKKGTPTQDVLKKIKDDPDNPFGSAIKERGGQSYYDDPNGKYTDPVTGKKQSLSLINKRAEEGDWGEWADKLPSQFLSKQPKYLVDKQLNLAISDKMAEFDEICSLTNPTVKKSLLSSFADSCDYDAVHLQAAALPRQKYQVILPITSMKDNEVYAPNYKNGETVALVRYPHGGAFEIPILTVNNKQAEARRVLGNTPKDAIGINSKVAERLSGADFDGDTVMVIPCNSGRSKVKITSTPQLIKDFDPKLEYGGKKEGTFKQMRDTQKEMGVISNLITDMTIKGATREELARAVRHSMVVTYEETLPHRKRDYWQMPCSLGADLSQGDDFCAFTFLFPLSNGSFGIKTRNYITSMTLMKLPAAMRIKYDQFMAEGSLIVLEGAVLDMMDVYEDLDNHISECGYDVRCLGFDPYNAKEFVARWEQENGPFGIEKVIQGAKTESVPLGELKKLSEERMLLFDEELMTFAMGNCITLEDTNGNRKLLKKRYEQKIDAVAAMMDAYIAYKLNRDAFD